MVRVDLRIRVLDVQLKHIDLNENMIRLIAKHAEAERSRRAHRSRVERRRLTAGGRRRLVQAIPAVKGLFHPNLG